MLTETTTADPAGLPSTSRTAADLELIQDIGSGLLDLARGIARSVGSRVRDALRSAGAVLPPLRVLVVDDSLDAADSLAAVLDLLGCQARVCYDGPSALRAVGGFRPDACLLDLMMPRMDGVELAGRLREATGPRPMLLVATTALGAVEDRTRTALAGFHYHLVKPVDSSTLLDALGRFGAALGRH